MGEFKDNEQAILQSEDNYNKNIKPVVAPDRKQDIDINNTLYNNIINAGFTSQLDISAISSLNQNAENRNQMYNMYDVMCEDGTIGAVVETYAEDATERNDDGKIVWVVSSNSEVSQMVDYLLDTLNIDKNIFKWTYSLCKYGDLYLRLFRESDYSDDLFGNNTRKPLKEDIKIKAYSNNDNYAHYMEMVSNPAEMFELTKFGKTVGYIKSPVINTIAKQDNTIFNTWKYKFKKGDITIFPATEFVHASLESNISREDELVSIFTNDADFDNDENAYSYKVKKGNSLLSNVYKVWRELNLLENSVLLNRVTKSSIIRLINVEIGDMPKEDVTKTLLGIKQMIEQKSAINQGVGMSEYTNPGPIENNVYVPTNDGKGQITTSQIGGDVDVKGLADLDYYTNKLFGQLRVPKQFFSNTDDSTGFNGGTSLSIISSRYAKMTKRIQNTILQALTDAINLMLLDKGLDAYVNDFELHMLPPTTQEEIDRRDNLSNKVGLTTDIMNMLTDIEDPVIKLKILKNLMTKIIDDTEIVTLLQDEIDKMESELPEPSPEPDNEPTIGDNHSLGSLTDFKEPSVSMDNDLPDNEDTSSNETTETDVLPSGEDLGVDLSNADEE